ncbi:carboxymuconolactone decarboxylase family protein [Pseudonocardia sp. GCM10023141]|uniref:carboxymuconolactone decarboxylase family protein n=1 Tax=Pseudonocardia sp. GCM10023141 TaxID=3252653 RepID=UPI0036159A2C
MTTDATRADTHPAGTVDPELEQLRRTVEELATRDVDWPPYMPGLVKVAVCASTTTLYLPGLRAAIREALAAGATREHVVEAIAQSSVLGIHAAYSGLPILRSELASAGLSEAEADPDLDARRTEIRTAFGAARGGWNETLDDILALDPELLAAYGTFSSVPWRSGRIPARFKELIYLAIDVQSTHLYEPGIRLHLGRAFTAGATREQVIAVIRIVTLIGFHAAEVGLPLLAEEVDRALIAARPDCTRPPLDASGPSPRRAAGPRASTS